MVKKLLSVLTMFIFIFCCGCNQNDKEDSSSVISDIASGMEMVSSEENEDESLIKTNAAVGDVSTGMALSWNYSKVLDISDIKLYFSENADMSKAQAYIINPHTSIHIIKDFETEKEYFWYVQLTLADGRIEKSEITSAILGMTDGPYVIEIDGVGNARDIGGLMTESGRRIKSGLLYRSGEMDSTTSVKITEAGIKTAINDLKIKTDLDLRKPEQIPDTSLKEKVSPLGQGIKYINYPAMEYSIKGDNNESEIMRVFADINNYPIIFHCVWGADRTGTVAYLLEMLVGVNEEDRIKDYELTGSRDRYYGGFSSMVSNIDKNIAGKTAQEKAYNIFSENFGLTDMEISNIYNILLTDSAVYSSDSLKTPIVKENGVYEFNLIMRNSKSVKNVQYNSATVKFALNGSKLTIYGINPTKNSIGLITFDDGSELRFDF